VRADDSVEDDSVGGVRNGPRWSAAREVGSGITMLGTTTGLVSPERPDGPLSENSSDTARCACGSPLDGYDAERDEATCERCAQGVSAVGYVQTGPEPRPDDGGSR